MVTLLRVRGTVHAGALDHYCPVCRDGPQSRPAGKMSRASQGRPPGKTLRTTVTGVHTAVMDFDPSVPQRTAGRTVCVVIADAHPVFRRGLESVLGEHPAIEVVDSVADGAALVRAVDVHRPHVVVTDLGDTDLGDTDLGSTIRDVLAVEPAVGVLVLSDRVDDDHLDDVLAAGARGYLSTRTDGESLTRAVLLVAEGDAVYGGEAASHLAARLATSVGVGSTAGGLEDLRLERSPRLTPRERDVLELLAAGHRNHDIAARLGLSEKTVRNHASHLLLKFGAEDRTSLVIRARDAGWGRR